MKKTGIAIAAAAAALLAAGAATSYVMGGKVQAGLERTAEEWSQPPLAIQVQSYERGWFSSTATTLWTVTTGDEPLQFTAQHAIQHGPWPRLHAAEILSTFAVNDDAPPEWVTAYKGKAPLVWRATVGWTQTSQHVLASPAIEGNFDGDQLRFGGFTADFEMPADGKGMKGTAQMPALALQTRADEQGSAPVDLQLAGSMVRFDVKQAAQQAFMVGSFHWALDQLRSTPHNGEAVTISGLVMDADTQLQGDVVHTTVSTQVQSLASPTYKASDIAVDVGLHNLDAAWLNQFTQGSQQLQGDPQALQALLLGGMQQLLAKKPVLEIKRLRWRTDDGVSELSASLAYQGDAAGLANPLAHVKASAQLNLPKPVLQSLMRAKARDAYLEQMEDAGQAPDVQQLTDAAQADATARIAMLVQSGILVEQGNQVTAQMDYTDGQVQANGKTLDGNGVMGLLQAMP